MGRTPIRLAITRGIARSFYFTTPVGVKHCDQRVCLYVCLSARISQKQHVQFHDIFCTCYLHRSSVIFSRKFNMQCTSGFVDNIMFSHNRAAYVVYIKAYRRRPRYVTHREATQTGAQLQSFSSAPLCVVSR